MQTMRRIMPANNDSRRPISRCNCWHLFMICCLTLAGTASDTEATAEPHVPAPCLPHGWRSKQQGVA
jgi:hypothetical protein